MIVILAILIYNHPTLNVWWMWLLLGLVWFIRTVQHYSTQRAIISLANKRG